ncbi:MAG: hypothetical protein JWN76_791 [Chitinophagaceae bacterium]|nr:hypothetical protein [Chitinophagaceae bacterium]
MAASAFSQSRFFLYGDWYKKRDYFEAGVSTGMMNCKTDIGKHGLWLNAPGFTFNTFAYVGYNSLDRWGVRLEYTQGSLESADAYIKNVNADSTKLRNLSFKSTLSEITLIGEIFPWNWAFEKVHDNFINPYVLAGVGWFHFNPTTEFQGSVIELRPLHLDGQGFPE